VSGRDERNATLLAVFFVLVLIAIFVLLFMFLAGHFGAEYGSYA